MQEITHDNSGIWIFIVSTGLAVATIGGLLYRVVA